MSSFNYNANQVSPFDLAGITRAVEQAVSSLKPGEHGAVYVSITPDRADFDLVVKGPSFGPIHSEALLTITKPKAAAWGYGLSARVAFAYGSVEPPRPAYLAQYRGWYRLLRHKNWNSPLASARKAAALCSGESVPLIGRLE